MTVLTTTDSVGGLVGVFSATTGGDVSGLAVSPVAGETRSGV